MKGTVYILINESMPGYVKVGFTEKELIDRIKALDTTSVPLPFECFFAARVDDCRRVEMLLHDTFSDQRVRNNREFFEIDPERIKSALLLTGGEEVTPDEGMVIDSNEDKFAISKKRERAASVDFDMIGLPTGTKLTFGKDHNIICEVSDSKNVCYEGEKMSLSRAALSALDKLGYKWQTVNGWAHWYYENSPLNLYAQKVMR